MCSFHPCLSTSTVFKETETAPMVDTITTEATQIHVPPLKSTLRLQNEHRTHLGFKCFGMMRRKRKTGQQGKEGG